MPCSPCSLQPEEASSQGMLWETVLALAAGAQVKALDFPGTTASYRQWQLEGIAGDVKEAIGRVSDGPFDAEQNANIPTVNYEAGPARLALLGAWITFKPGMCSLIPASGCCTHYIMLTHLANPLMALESLEGDRACESISMLTRGAAGFAACCTAIRKVTAPPGVSLTTGLNATKHFVVHMQLPDGTEIQVGPDRFKVPEVLFQPVR